MIELIAAGCTRREAAARLRVSPRTVETHLRTARHRADARSIAELVARCCAAGIFQAGHWPPHRSGRLCLRIAEPA